MSAPVTKFYCEFCGSLVRPGDRICPHCGSFFAQVRCPVCNYEGEAKLFYHGCPVCGFAQAKQAASPPTEAGGKTSPARPGKPPRYELAYEIEDEAPKKPAGTPSWVFVLMGLAFLVVLIAAIFVSGMRA